MTKMIKIIKKIRRNQRILKNKHQKRKPKPQPQKIKNKIKKIRKSNIKNQKITKNK
jgi:hypothetical protein